MILSIQIFIEDYCSNRNLLISDDYAIQMAKMFVESDSKESFLLRMKRVKTKFSLDNQITRKNFEEEISKLLFDRFPQKVLRRKQGVGVKKRIRNHIERRSIEKILNRFVASIEADSIETFWLSRPNFKLRKNPEEIGQNLLYQFIKGELKGSGILIREKPSGIGFIDIVVRLSSVNHLIEVKVVIDKFIGAEQLNDYMKTENRKIGYLLFFDSRSPEEKTDIDYEISVTMGKIKSFVIDINPTPPSRKNKSIA